MVVSWRRLSGAAMLALGGALLLGAAWLVNEVKRVPAPGARPPGRPLTDMAPRPEPSQWSELPPGLGSEGPAVPQERGQQPAEGPAEGVRHLAGPGEVVPPDPFAPREAGADKR